MSGYAVTICLSEQELSLIQTSKHSDLPKRCQVIVGAQEANRTEKFHCLSRGETTMSAKVHTTSESYINVCNKRQTTIIWIHSNNFWNEGITEDKFDIYKDNYNEKISNISLL